MVRIAILCREPKVSFSMDVHAHGLIRGLRAVRPQWEIVELRPVPTPTSGNPWLNGAKKYYRRYWQYPRTARQQDVDLFHVIDHSDGHLVYELPKTGKPVVVTCHDLINFLQPDNIRDQARLAWVSTAIWKYAVQGIGHADQIITVSQYTADNVVQLLQADPNKITAIPNGLDPAFKPLSTQERQALRQRHQISQESFCLLHVGSNHPRKNVETVLNVLLQLREKGLPVCLIKAGADFNAAQIAFIETHQLASAILHLHKPNLNGLIEAYNLADVLLSPSLYEGFGITPLEAMACDTPVITSNTTALPEVVGEAGITVQPLDGNTITQEVMRLITDPAHRQQLIEWGRERITIFTWENTAEQVAQVYEKLLDQSPQAL